MESKRNKKSRILKKSLYPILYDGSIACSKPTTQFLKENVYPHLQRMFNLCSANSTINIDRQLQKLLESIPQENTSENFYIKNSQIFRNLYYTGMIAYKNNIHNNYEVYKEFNLTKNEGYTVIAICLIKLNCEKSIPLNNKWDFLVVPEHVISTYNLLCYHSKKYYDEVLIKKIICIILKITEDYIEYVNSLE